MDMKKYFENRIETLQNKRTELKNGIENLSAEEIKDRFSQIDNIDTEIADCKAQLTEIENAWQAQQNPQPQGGVNVKGTAGGTAVTDKFNTTEYKNKFMDFFCRGTKIKNEAGTTTTTDASAVIPTELSTEIIQKVESYGNLYAKVTKTNIKVGYSIPVLSLKPTATWFGESSATTSAQKLKADEKITFSAYGLEVKVSRSLFVEVMAYDQFKALFVPLMTEAIVKAIEGAIVNGSGTDKPLGITKDTRVPTGNVISLTEAEFKSWEAWQKKVVAKIKKSYQHGEFIMEQSTYSGYINGMVDADGQPIARTNYGIDNGETYYFAGKHVETTEDDIIKSFDSAAVGDVVAIFCDLKNYVLNSNLQITAGEWYDHDTHETKNNMLLVCDGKLADANGVYLIKKAATPSSGK
ncbi:phage major capsid protein [Oscillospiraceae bacterium LCP25S3_E10]|nr:phage major capsid protein [Ruminococcus sp.]